ncbi:uncharacterized protein RCO7_05717 [Rhynchosporium graminicola]|uniref:Uncharacterized protein n=1 Tax=Rhynchosporium graminicola TaxID=2792576 RepID=A0A1E1KBN2_9HELO|nr:uncharacterized protein RCO7_05717 [Rhynchosporium commune]
MSSPKPGLWGMVRICDGPLGCLKMRLEKREALARDRLFVLYDELDGFLGEVEELVGDGEVRGWWRVVWDLRMITASFRGHNLEFREEKEDAGTKYEALDEGKDTEDEGEDVADKGEIEIENQAV